MISAHTHFLVLGAGISGRSVAAVLAAEGTRVTLNDVKTIDETRQEYRELADMGVSIVSGRQDSSLLSGVDTVVVSPGITIHLPLLDEARSRGITVMSEIEVAYRLCRAPIIAITGTNGKTTTTTLVGEMIKESGRPTVVGGNIGLALSQEVRGVDAKGMVVAEISSFQLEGVISFRPHIAAVLNLTPDHLDRHGGMEGYQLAKERIFAHQTADDYVILNYDDAAVRAMAGRAASRILYFSLTAEPDEGAFLQDGSLCLKRQGAVEPICPVADLKLLGRHNVENALAACCAAMLAGVPAGVMAAVLRSFAGVEHRIEPVAVIHGIPYYNDSKATNPESSVKALEAFAGHLILIAGGRDKNTDLSEFMTLAKERVDHLILIGEAAKRFGVAATQHGVTAIHRAGSLAEAVNLARRLARPPQAVLLSPACASYDMFNNYEERGRVFKELVHQLA